MDLSVETGLPSCEAWVPATSRVPWAAAAIAFRFGLEGSAYLAFFTSNTPSSLSSRPCCRLQSLRFPVWKRNPPEEHAPFKNFLCVGLR